MVYLYFGKVSILKGLIDNEKIIFGDISTVHKADFFKDILSYLPENESFTTYYINKDENSKLYSFIEENIKENSTLTSIKKMSVEEIVNNYDKLYDFVIEDIALFTSKIETKKVCTWLRTSSEENVVYDGLLPYIYLIATYNDYKFTMWD